MAVDLLKAHGYPLDDLAQLAWYAVPLRGDAHWRKAGFSQEPDLAGRLALIAATYGAEPAALLRTLLKLQAEECRRIKVFGKQGIFPWHIFYQRGDHSEILAETEWLRQRFDALVR